MMSSLSARLAFWEKTDARPHARAFAMMAAACMAHEYPSPIDIWSNRRNLRNVALEHGMSRDEMIVIAWPIPDGPSDAND
ncbi:hypothetical protein E4U43_006249 [Claviceps pusilla]|uniref:Uncharacterized protein n=1 Tax=Claviceps pusilla TaxID=123648 RepID=A0A9P7NGB9_9HYPO|nr:hypothetical protein E4U43_006249 [Claviceps pusilla]